MQKHPLECSLERLPRTEAQSLDPQKTELKLKQRDEIIASLKQELKRKDLALLENEVQRSRSREFSAILKELKMLRDENRWLRESSCSDWGGNSFLMNMMEPEETPEESVADNTRGLSAPTSSVKTTGKHIRALPAGGGVDGNRARSNAGHHGSMCNNKAHSSSKFVEKKGTKASSFGGELGSPVCVTKLFTV